MLEHSDLRAEIPIFFMASSGMRMCCLVGLTDEDIQLVLMKRQVKN
ncbi:MAG: hypothetical protein WA631_16510 [Nitrososphaeraceae archaeon]